MKNITKLYAAYKAGYLGDNILDTYFTLVANMILEKHLRIIQDTVIVSEIKERYQIELPIPFVRQILGIGVKNNCFIDDHGKYSVAINELSKYKFDETDFTQKWNQLIDGFRSHCNENKIDFSSILINDFILDILDEMDDVIFTNDIINNDQSTSTIKYAWYSFVKNEAEKTTDLYDFIAAISASNITRQALFFNGETKANYSGLNVYLDSPIIFALLGMADTSRTDSYKKLINDIAKANCNIHVLDHNFQEVEGIINRAANWANNTAYDLRKANNAARFFHDSQMSNTEITEFCERIEDELNKLGVTVKKTEYDIFQNKFQEDEDRLFDMVKERYLEYGCELLPEKEESVRIDVRSITMIYRERQGKTATRLQNAKHIMLTSNNTIANVSKKYESSLSIQSGYIPACISADLFGAILWLNNPIQMQEYQKQKLLADCYSFLKPNRALIDKYIQSLDDARAGDKIDEKKFLFLRTHKVVLDSLMDITQGDYARFNSNTYLEIYEDIQLKANKKYNDEVAAHKQTKNELEDIKTRESKKIKEKDRTIQELEQKVQSFEDEKRNKFEIKVKWYGWAITIALIGIPYILLLVLLEVFKSIHIKIDNTADVSLYLLIKIILTIVTVVIIRIFFEKGKTICFKIARKILQRN
ncbi:hypothetical protein F2N07_05550 [Campylobacter jejuni]|nr:hypothetical protein [Campylobacter jejuni]MBT0858660.1 hypothetical protein [Campylobacter coli]